MSADACEEVAQLGAEVDAESLAGRDYAGEYGCRPPAIIAAREHPVLAAHCDPTQAALGAVVVDLQITILTLAGERPPVRQRIGNSLSFGMLR
jgi:hypothetical protein